MTTTMRRSTSTEHLDLDPAGVRALDAAPARQRRDAPLPGLAADTVLAVVQRVEPPWPVAPLAWGVADGRIIVFRVDEETAETLRAAVEAGEEPSAIVGPDQIVAMELGPR